MKKHICKNCGRTYDYCRGCLLSPIPYKEAGFCSKECSAEFKNKKIEEVIQIEDVEVVIDKEDTSASEEEIVEYPYFFTEIKEEEKEENDINDDKQNYGEELRTERGSIPN